VLLDADYTARLADFGYASLVGNIPEALTYLQRSTARPGALRWIAPEQVDSEEMFKPTTKTDIYSFGCIALQGCFIHGFRCQALADIPADFVWQITMVGSQGRPGHCIAPGEGAKARPTSVSNVERLTLGFDSRLLVSNTGTPCCGSGDIHH